MNRRRQRAVIQSSKTALKNNSLFLFFFFQFLHCTFPILLLVIVVYTCVCVCVCVCVSVAFLLISFNSSYLLTTQNKHPRPPNVRSKKETFIYPLTIQLLFCSRTICVYILPLPGFVCTFTGASSFFFVFQHAFVHYSSIVIECCFEM